MRVPLFLRSSSAWLAAWMLTSSVGCVAETKTATIVALESAPRALSLSKTARVWHLARGRNAYLGRLELEPGAKVPLHRDSTEEFIYVLEGGGHMTIDGAPYDVTVGHTIYMPANVEVSFQNGPTKTVALQVFAGPEPADKYESWSPLP